MRTQGERIICRLKQGAATYGQLIRVGAGNWPHKRLVELEKKGYRFRRQWSLGNRRYRLISLVGEPK